MDEARLEDKIDEVALTYFDQWIVMVNEAGKVEGKRPINEKETELLKKGFLAGWWSNYLLSADHSVIE